MYKVFLIFFTFLCGCAQTWITSPDTPQEVLKLAEKNTRRIMLNFEDADTSKLLGIQYALFVMPAGMVRTDSVTKLISERLFTELSLKGYNPLINIGNSVQNVAYPVLNIKLEDISLNAYDFFFFRLLKSNVEIKITLYQPNKPAVISNSRKSELRYRLFGFKPQLERLINDLIKESVNENLLNLNI